MAFPCELSERVQAPKLLTSVEVGLGRDTGCTGAGKVNVVSVFSFSGESGWLDWGDVGVRAPNPSTALYFGGRPIYQEKGTKGEKGRERQGENGSYIPLASVPHWLAWERKWGSRQKVNTQARGRKRSRDFNAIRNNYMNSKRRVPWRVKTEGALVKRPHPGRAQWFLDSHSLRFLTGGPRFHEAKEPEARTEFIFHVFHALVTRIFLQPALLTIFCSCEWICSAFLLFHVSFWTV